MSKQTFITASEIGEYVYCPRAWWLRWQGLSPENGAMRAGSRQHVLLARFVELLPKLLRAALIFFILGGVLLLYQYMIGGTE